jgi:hypothetical protein
MTEYRNTPPELNERDIEQLSAYLDEQLTPEEISALETRLRDDAFLRDELEAMQRTVALIRTLKPLQAPRNFALSAADIAGIEQEEPPTRIIRPAFRGGWIAGLAAAFMIVLIGIVLVLPNMSGDSAPEALSVADQPTETLNLAQEEPVEEAAELDFTGDAPPAAAESRAMVTPTVQASPLPQTQATFLPTTTALAAMQQTPTPALTGQATFGAVGIGLTETYGAPVGTPIPEQPLVMQDSVQDEADSAADDGAALGGMAGEAVEEAPEADTDVQAEGGAANTTFATEPDEVPESEAAVEEDAVSGTSLLYEEEEAQDDAAEAELSQQAVPPIDLPAPQTLLQTALRWLIFLLQTLFGAGA